jgi:hypothetical protein
MTNRSSTGWIATLFTVLFMAHVSFGQSDSLALASGTTAANGTVSLNLVLTSPAGNEPAAVQWTVTFPAGNVTAISEAPGSSATSAGKTLSCASGSGTYTCVASGLNANIITNGPLAVVNLTMASGVASTAIGVSNALGASAAGSSITISATGGHSAHSAYLCGMSSDHFGQLRRRQLYGDTDWGRAGRWRDCGSFQQQCSIDGTCIGYRCCIGNHRHVQRNGGDDPK